MKERAQVGLGLLVGRLRPEGERDLLARDLRRTVQEDVGQQRLQSFLLQFGNRPFISIAREIAPTSECGGSCRRLSSRNPWLHDWCVK